MENSYLTIIDWEIGDKTSGGSDVMLLWSGDIA